MGLQAAAGAVRLGARAGGRLQRGSGALGLSSPPHVPAVDRQDRTAGKSISCRRVLQQSEVHLCCDGTLIARSPCPAAAPGCRRNRRAVPTDLDQSTAGQHDGHQTVLTESGVRSPLAWNRLSQSPRFCWSADYVGTPLQLPNPTGRFLHLHRLLLHRRRQRRDRGVLRRRQQRRRLLPRRLTRGLRTQSLSITNQRSPAARHPCRTCGSPRVCSSVPGS